MHKRFLLLFVIRKETTSKEIFHFLPRENANSYGHVAIVVVPLDDHHLVPVTFEKNWAKVGGEREKKNSSVTFDKSFHFSCTHKRIQKFKFLNSFIISSEFIIFFFFFLSLGWAAAIRVYLLICTLPDFL